MSDSIISINTIRGSFRAHFTYMESPHWPGAQSKRFVPATNYFVVHKRDEAVLRRKDRRINLWWLASQFKAIAKLGVFVVKQVLPQARRANSPRLLFVNIPVYHSHSYSHKDLFGSPPPTLCVMWDVRPLFRQGKCWYNLL